MTIEIKNVRASYFDDFEDVTGEKFDDVVGKLQNGESSVKEAWDANCYIVYTALIHDDLDVDFKAWKRSVNASEIAPAAELVVQYMTSGGGDTPLD